MNPLIVLAAIALVPLACAALTGPLADLDAFRQRSKERDWLAEYHHGPVGSWDNQDDQDNQDDIMDRLIALTEKQP